MGLSMEFNPDMNKQATEVYLSQRRAKSLPPRIVFNNNALTSPCQKHLGFVLDSKLSFNEHVNRKMNKCNRILGLMERLSLTLSRKQLLTIYKTFVRSHLDYADIICDKSFNDAFKDKLEKVQYSVRVVITKAIKGISREGLYKELGLESLCDKRWYRKLVFFYKIVKGLTPSYIHSCLFPDNERTYNTRSNLRNTIKTFATRTSTFPQLFFLIAQKNGINQMKTF